MPRGDNFMMQSMILIGWHRLDYGRSIIPSNQAVGPSLGMTSPLNCCSEWMQGPLILPPQLGDEPFLQASHMSVDQTQLQTTQRGKHILHYPSRAFASVLGPSLPALTHL